MSDFEDLAKSYSALEQLALAKMTDAEKVQWYQQRTMSAEEANQKLRATLEIQEVLTKFPGVKPAALAGAKNRADMEAIATVVKAAIEEAKAEGQTTVEAAVKEALKQSDDQIAEMRKVYGKPRQPQAGDVTGSQIEGLKEAQKVGVGTAEEKFDPTKGDTEGAARRIFEPFAQALGFGTKEK